MNDPADYLEHRRALIEQALSRSIPDAHPVGLYEPARYVMEAGGKRLRPLLVLLAAEAHGARPEDALPAAVAVEVFHNFTLVHDDIMDHSDSRRGRPSVHVRWDEPTAILVGDLLMGVAYDHLARLSSPVLGRAFASFSRCVARLCEGQVLDMEFERRHQVSLAEYVDMIERKTGALLACALDLGALVGGADEERCAQLASAGLDIGRAFQIQDDLLDLTAASEDWGKPVGGDVLEGKRTYLLLNALERVGDSGLPRDLLDRVMGRSASPSDIPLVRDWMEQAGVLSDTHDAVIFHTDAALSRLAILDDSPAKAALLGLVRSMQRRVR